MAHALKRRAFVSRFGSFGVDDASRVLGPTLGRAPTRSVRGRPVASPIDAVEVIDGEGAETLDDRHGRLLEGGVEGGAKRREVRLRAVLLGDGRVVTSRRPKTCDEGRRRRGLGRVAVRERGRARGEGARGGVGRGVEHADEVVGLVQGDDGGEVRAGRSLDDVARLRRGIRELTAAKGARAVAHETRERSRGDDIGRAGGARDRGEGVTAAHVARGKRARGGSTTRGRPIGGWNRPKRTRVGGARYSGARAKRDAAGVVHVETCARKARIARSCARRRAIDARAWLGARLEVRW